VKVLDEEDIAKLGMNAFLAVAGGSRQPPKLILMEYHGDTDSEGRVVLCDALTYAEKYEPVVLVDVATLTGAIVSALGEIATGVFSNSEALVREVLAAGDSAWDRAWHMPPWHEYQGTLKSNIADLANVSPRGYCAITAASRTIATRSSDEPHCATMAR
jgi:leucyl aminopeptidase